MAADSLSLEVVTPDREVVREAVADVQLPAKNGYLGILPGHTPLLCELGIGALHYTAGGEVRHVAILEGFAEVTGSRVTVLADAAERSEEINAAEAQKAATEARAALSPGANKADANWDGLLRSLAIANVRLEVAERGAGRSAAHCPPQPVFLP